MSESLLLVAGASGQALFFLRFLIQWVASERAGRVVVPRLFWKLSIVGSVLLAAYAVDRREPVFLAGLFVNFFVYWRQLAIEGVNERAAGHDRQPEPLRRLRGRALLAAFTGLVGIASIVALLTVTAFVEKQRLPSPLWLAAGSTGQLLWVLRFPWQWWASERSGLATLGPGFFWLSFVGGSLLLAYAIALRDPVWIAGYLLPPILSLRNLALHRRRTRLGDQARAES